MCIVEDKLWSVLSTCNLVWRGGFQLTMGAVNPQWQPHLGTTGFLVDDPRKEQAGILLGLILRWVLEACQSMMSGCVSLRARMRWERLLI